MAQGRRPLVPLPLARPRPYPRRYQTFPRPRSRERMVGDLSSLPVGFIHPCLNLFAASTTVVSSSIAPPKKFSAVKINKRFMEQNSSTPGASQTLSSSPSSKSASTTGAIRLVLLGLPNEWFSQVSATACHIPPSSCYQANKVTFVVREHRLRMDS